MEQQRHGQPASEKPAKLTIFRKSDAPTLMEANCMVADEVTPLMQDYIGRLYQAGLEQGHEVKVLFNIQGFSLTYVWFKRNYPLPLHRHNCDCLYYIIAGSLEFGTEKLGRGDGFFLPSDLAYSYTGGPNGVELLEFRHSDHFNIRFLATTAAFWEKAIEKVRIEIPNWKEAKLPPFTEGLGQEV